MLIAAAVAYQFAKIGNDKAAQDPAVGLGEHDIPRDNIDSLGTPPGYGSQQLFVHVS